MLPNGLSLNQVATAALQALHIAATAAGASSCSTSAAVAQWVPGAAIDLINTTQRMFTEVSGQAAQRRVFCAVATDRRVRKEGGAKITQEAARVQLDHIARGQLRELHVYVGMRGVLTHNKSLSDDFINGATGVVT